MFDLQEKLIELSQYGVSFNVANGNFVVKIKYDGDWTIIKPNESIGFYSDESDNCVYYYVAPITIGLDKIFSTIDETIEYNHELEQKVILFKNKMAELQEIFTQEPIDVLNTLEFKMKKRKTPVKKERQTDVEQICKSNDEGKKTDETEKDIDEDKLSDIDAKINEALSKKNKQ